MGNAASRINLSGRHVNRLLHPEDGKKIKEALDLDYEIGGTLYIDEVTNSFRIKEMVSGGNSEIDISEGNLFEFHTHPNTCIPGSGSCALGPPSIEDLENIYERQLKSGNCMHIVFSHDGTFVVTCKNDLSATNVANTISELNTLQTSFYLDEMSYKTFLQNWLYIVNIDTCPFRVQFIPAKKECKTCVFEVISIDVSCVK